jgi:hypothetical protein
MPSPDFLRPILASFDYQLEVEPGPPALCRARHADGEKWEATGASIDEAMDKLVHMMCPSTMAWDLFLEALHVSARPSSGARSTTPAPPPSAPRPPPVAKSDRPEKADLPDRSQDPTLQIPTMARAPAQPVHVEVVDAAPSEGSAILELEAALPVIARCAPERQRLELLRRVCVARAAAPKSPELARDAIALAGRASDLARTLWPGNVLGLRSDARPADVGSLGVRAAAAPATWSEAADLVASVLATLATTKGRDTFGWADAAQLSPPPADPAALLESVVVEIEALVGPPSGPIPRRVDARGPRLATVARRLRWLRKICDPMGWGAALGRVRRALSDLGAEAEGAGRLLDPAFSPDGPWADLETDEVKPSGVRSSVPSSAAAPASRRAPEPPRPGAPAGELASWAVKALDLYDTPEVVALARTVGAELKNLGESGIPTGDRRIRRKWR